MIQTFLIITVAQISGLITDNYDWIKASILLFLLGYSIFSLFVIIIKNNFKIIASKSSFYLMIYFLYLIFLFVISSKRNLDFYSTLLYFPIMYSSTRISLNNFTKRNQFKKIFILQNVTFLLFFLMYFYGRIIMGQNNGLLVNSIYYQVMLLPFILLIEKKFVRNLLLVFLLAAIVYSTKRTALIAVVISLIIYMTNSSKGSSVFSGNRILKFIGVVLFLSLSILVSSNYLDAKFGFDIVDRLLNVFIDGGSGRSELISESFNNIKETSLLNLLFGNNLNPTLLSNSSQSVHNDFIVSVSNILLFV